MAESESKQMAVDIAVLQAELRGLREQQKAHAEHANKRLDTVEDKIDYLTSAITKGGAKGAILWTLGMAAVAGSVSWVFGHLLPFGNNGR